MHEHYDYVHVRLDPGAVAGFRRHLVEAGGQVLATIGGVLCGVWVGAGSVGWSDDELVAMVGWTGEPHDAQSLLFDGRSGVTDSVVHPVQGTVRPERPAALAAGGVFAHRWFDFASDDWNEFLALSTEAWKTFEDVYDAEIVGLFRSTDVTEPNGRALLLTRYASFAEWERSRGALRSDERSAEAGRRFLRRREITTRTLVRIAPLATA